MRKSLCILFLSLASGVAQAETSSKTDTSNSKHQPGSHKDQTTGAFSSEMHTIMAKMDKDMKAVSMSSDPDRMFAEHMIPHHQGAIDMANAYLKVGRNAKLRSMAEKMVSDQEKEVKDLKSMLNSELSSRAD